MRRIKRSGYCKYLWRWDLNRKFFFTIVLGAILLIRAAFAGFASEGSKADILKASGESYYHWVKDDTIFRVHCAPNELISLENCGEEASKRKSLKFESVKEHLPVLLTHRLKFEEKSKKLQKTIDYLEQQIALLKKGTPSPEKQKKIGELTKRLEQAVRDKANLFKPLDIYNEFVDALTTPPDQIAIAGDGLYPNAEKHVDLLAMIFRLVPMDDVSVSWCERTTHSQRRLWSFISDSISRYSIESVCERINARMPHMTDLKGPNHASIYDIEGHHRWHHRGCLAFAESPIGKALPRFASPTFAGARKAMWLSDNTGMFGPKTIAALIGDSGEPCSRNGPYRIDESRKLGGACITEVHRYDRHGEFPESVIEKLPCGNG